MKGTPGLCSSSWAGLGLARAGHPTTAAALPRGHGSACLPWHEWHLEEPGKTSVPLWTLRGPQSRSTSPNTTAAFASDLCLPKPRGRQALQELLSFLTLLLSSTFPPLPSHPRTQHPFVLLPTPASPHRELALPPWSPALQSSAPWLQAAHNSTLMPTIEPGDPCSLVLCTAG